MTMIRMGLTAAVAALLCGCPAPQKKDAGPVMSAEPADQEDVAPLPASIAPAPSLPHAPAGELLPKTVVGFTNGYPALANPVAPQIRFPLYSGPAFANSQAFNPGGSGYDYDIDGANPPPVVRYPGVAGLERTPSNFDYPWRDNFCEVRGHTNGVCPEGHGHQGQDVRPATRDIGKYCIVAPERSRVDGIGSRFLVHLHGLESGHGYSLMHMDSKSGLTPNVKVGAVLERGDPIARVANIMGDCPRKKSDCTTTHLHFEIWTGAFADNTNRGVKPHPPYTSLIESYLDLVAENPDQFEPGARADAPSPCDGPF